MMDAMLHDPTTWVALSFLIFCWLFARYGLSHVLRMLDNRSVAIAHELNEAARLHAEAQQLLLEYQQRQRDMMAEAKAIMAQAVKEADALRQHAEKDLKEAIERRSKMAQEKIARMQTAAIADLQQNVTSLAVSAARLVLSQHLDEKTDAVIIDDALKSVDRITH